MLKKANVEADKTEFNTSSPFRQNREQAGINNSNSLNNRGSSLEGNNIDKSRTENNSYKANRNDMGRMANALYGRSIGTVLMPNIGRRYRFGKEAGYSSYMNKHAKAETHLQEGELESNNRSYAIYSSLKNSDSNNFANRNGKESLGSSPDL